MGLVEKLRAKYELYRLEQRYARRREKRTTFYSDAQYVDGEYVYSPSSARTTSTTATHNSTANAAVGGGRAPGGFTKRMSSIRISELPVMRTPTGNKRHSMFAAPVSSNIHTGWRS